MCSVIAALLIVLSGFLGYSAVAYQSLSEQPSAVETTSCPMPSSREDITNALAIADDVFDPSLWTVEISNDISILQTTISWISPRLGSVAFLAYLHYDCGVTPRAISQYLSPEGFDVILSNYRPYEQTDHCKINGTELYEFDVVTGFGDDAHALFWVKQTSPTRVVTMNLVFLDIFQVKQAEYARRLFPELPSCTALETGNLRARGDSFRVGQGG